MIRDKTLAKTATLSFVYVGWNEGRVVLVIYLIQSHADIFENYI